ncbi:MAG: M1 family metallopeptidase [Lewinellaceae bacterium]|nr:M1 family metallopeptidase [Lewinellaceae bacterium]
MKIKFLFLLPLLVLTELVVAQQLFMPLNIRKAYDNNTRAMDGKPGAKYWQNKASYKIDMQVDLATREVSGTEKIDYTNNSPDTLKFIRVKLAHDLWKKNAVRAFEINTADLTDGVDIQQVSINNRITEAEQYNRGNTFLNIKLYTPLAPGESVNLGINWSYIAAQSKGTPRECVCDSTTWFLAYSYPQVAVYDDLHGWADTPYSGLQEMYNDFSDYEVRITVPANAMVWATGVWQNPDEMLESEFLRRYNTAQKIEDVVSIFTQEDYKNKRQFFKKGNNGTHSFVYKAEAVPDFALAFSDHFLWDATTITVDAKTGRKTLVSAAYNPDSKDYYEVCRVAADGLKLMSTWLPGYPYPYPRMTVFNGDDGMEFPMMCNDVSTFPRSPVGLTVHESSHTYFPFMMGINEQMYAWMDEGWAAFFDVLVTDSVAGQPQGSLRDYPTFAGTDIDMPPMTPSRNLAYQSYRVASYNRPQAAYMNLYQMLGYKRFHKCMVEYMDRWKGKHPQPFDFFNTWNDASGENLDWFWKPWFFDWGYPDLAVQGLSQKGKKASIVIENMGTMPMSAYGEIEYADGSKETFKRTAEVWKKGNKTISIPLASGKMVKKVTLGDPHVSDANPGNNIWEKK